LRGIHTALLSADLYRSLHPDIRLAVRPSDQAAVTGYDDIKAYITTRRPIAQ